MLLFSSSAVFAEPLQWHPVVTSVVSLVIAERIHMTSQPLIGPWTTISTANFFCFLNKWLWNDVFKIHFYWLRYRTIAEKKIAGNRNLPPLVFTWAGSGYSFRSGFLPRFYWTGNALCLSQQASRQMWSLFAVKVSANEFGQVQCSSNTGLKNPRHNAQLAVRWRQRDVKKAAAVSQWWRSLLIYF